MSTIKRSFDVALQLNDAQQQHLCFYLNALEIFYINVIKQFEHQVSLLKQQRKFQFASQMEQRRMVLRRSWTKHSTMDAVGTTLFT